MKTRSSNWLARCRWIAGITLLVMGSTALSGPVYENPDDVPKAFRFDLIFSGATLVLQIPVLPAGRGTALAGTTMTGLASSYSAEQGYLLVGPPDDNNAGSSIEPAAGTIRVPTLSGDKNPLEVEGKGALRLDESVPRTIRVRNADGTVSVRDVKSRAAYAGSTVAEIESATEGMLAVGVSEWLTGRDVDDATAGDQGGLAQIQLHIIARSEHGPELDATSAGLTENVLTGLPRGAVPLAPEVSLHLDTTLGLAALPKLGREGRAVFSFQGLASFSPDPLWSWTVEYRPDGTVLQDFIGSAALRKADDINARLDDVEVEAALKALLRIDDNGVLSTAGLIDINDEVLFHAQIASPRRFDYTQRMALYVGLTVPEPAPASLLLLATGAAAVATRHRRKPRIDA